MNEVKNALVWVVLTAIVVVLAYVISVGDIFKLDWRVMINLGVLSLCNGVISLIKSFMTNYEKGTIAGIKVKK